VVGKNDVPEFVIEREFSAPRELVWKCWTDAKRLARWWVPGQFSWGGATLDLRVGGMFHYCMRWPDGRDMWGKFVYHEIVAPERLVFVSSSSDKDGGITRAPWFADWPLEVLNTLVLHDAGAKTKMRLSAHPINANDAELKRFVMAQPGMSQGFGGVFKQLDQLLVDG